MFHKKPLTATFRGIFLHFDAHKKSSFSAKKLPAVDFLKIPPFTQEPVPHIERPREKSVLKKALLYSIIFISITVTGFTTKIIISSTEFTKNFSGGGIFSQLKNLILRKENDIA